MDSLVIPITVTIIVVLFAIQRLGTGVGRPHVRADHARLVRDDRRARHSRHHDAPGGPEGALAELCRRLPVPQRDDRLLLPRRRGSRDHRRARRSTPTWVISGDPAITRAWLLLVFPACILSYLGQGALILDDPSAISAPFFLLMPHAGLIPLVILATMATVIASQAVISGAFSIAHQAAQLGYLPRLRVIHTSTHVRPGLRSDHQLDPAGRRPRAGARLPDLGQARLCLRDGGHGDDRDHDDPLLRHRPPPLAPAALAGAVGGAASSCHRAWRSSRANLTKFFHGAWLPLLIGVILFIVMTTWFRGRALVTEERFRVEGPLEDFVEKLRAQEAAGHAGSRHRGLPEPRQGDGAALDARLRRPPPFASGERGHPLAGDACRFRGSGPRSGSRSMTSATGTTASPSSGPGTAMPRSSTCRSCVRQIAKAGVECPVDARHASFYLSRVELKAADRAGYEPLAQAALPGRRP